MKKHLFIIICCVLIGISIVFIANPGKTDVKNTVSNHLIDESIPIKIEEIDYELVRTKNEKGEDLVYIRYKNNGKYNINSFSIEVEMVNDDYGFWIENLIPVRPGQRSDNFDLTTTKDERTWKPINDKHHNFIKDLGPLKQKCVSYNVYKNHKVYFIEYDLNTKEYEVAIN